VIRKSGSVRGAVEQSLRLLDKLAEGLLRHEQTYEAAAIKAA